MTTVGSLLSYTECRCGVEWNGDCAVGCTINTKYMERMYFHIITTQTIMVSNLPSVKVGRCTIMHPASRSGTAIDSWSASSTLTLIYSGISQVSQTAIFLTLKIINFKEIYTNPVQWYIYMYVHVLHLVHTSQRLLQWVQMFRWLYSHFNQWMILWYICTLMFKAFWSIGNVSYVTLACPKVLDISYCQDMQFCTK